MLGGAGSIIHHVVPVFARIHDDVFRQLSSFLHSYNDNFCAKWREKPASEHANVLSRHTFAYPNPTLHIPSIHNICFLNSIHMKAVVILVYLLISHERALSVYAFGFIERSFRF